MFDLEVKKNPSQRSTSTEADLHRLKAKFRLVLNAKLLKKYGRIPTNKKFAEDFNHAAVHKFTISSETARKWISGKVVPSGPRMHILSQWLSFSLEGVIKQDDLEFKGSIQLEELLAIIENLSPYRLNIILNIAREFISHEIKNAKR
jgi:hypothetical protein